MKALSPSSFLEAAREARAQVSYFPSLPFSPFFSHMRLRKPTGSLVLDRSIRDSDLARCIRALSCKSEQSNASPIVGIVPLRR